VTPAKVLQVAASAGWAGGEVYLMTLARALDQRRFRLAVVAPEDGPLIPRLEARGVRVVRVPLNARLVNPRALRDLVRLFRQEKPAIVQSHGARPNVYAKLAGRLARVPVILATVHNSLFDYEVNPYRRWCYILAEQLTTRFVDRVLAVSSAIESDLVLRYGIPADTVITIHNGIDAEAFAPRRSPAAVRRELGLDGDERLIGVAARMTPQKGHYDLLHALPRLSQRFPRLRCLLIGDGPLKSSLEVEAARLGVGPYCLFTGARADVADLLSVLEVVALPSLSEGLPFVLLEAMALRKPVVATRVGGNPEVVEDGKTGLLVPPRDPGALAGALASLLDRPTEAAGMGERGGIRVRESFTLDRMIRALENTYTMLLQRKGLRSADPEPHR